ncbi:hypothetical protein K458DRAFT_72325 [Lentithecium fluviatile CBS 122367]|uniref:Uncharacterized protein n=1 Tax=Lentithecium fluviatile CBS 122367 TaxID=1168545 RepID=A0A6G1IVI2_9PLEO|nr:hypothetical protein K458DRAFT_72325 [Lentithecium fluviatile CBS 122367]
MAEQITHDVVKEAQSMGGVSPIDDSASTTNTSAGNGEAPSGPTALDSKPSDAPPTTNATNDAAAVGTEQPRDTAGGDAAPTTTTSSQIQFDAPPKETKEHLVNGEAGEHLAAESQTAVADASGGSDTDISRPGSVDQAKRPEGHVRTNSAVKKPTSFKSVSVTKNFLAKSAVTVPTARPGDKTANTAQTSTLTLQTAKPRLVAKSGGSNVPRSLGTLNGAGSGPDASKVWNKNQPVPPPPPKQFTDEELKQQYGIHLATRLQADDGGKEAKWADIDDDEDDWAPETVQWMDGTKSSVAAVENQPPPPEEPTSAPKMETPTILSKPSMSGASSTPKPSLTGGTKTILKPGAHVASTSKTKGQQDKPTLVAKPSAAAPVKSPWAPLPPVDKVAPIPINPPAQHPPHSRFSRDSHGYDSMPPIPAKEIAPDDFNRSWRDERGNRELFNSHNGRYEPVSEMRRGSTRDTSYRQTAVLQRPAYDGPAEPSAAFQTSRTSGDAPSWGRRRNSSNVSGGSGRRMSFDRRGPDLPPMPMTMQRRESTSINGVDSGAPGTPRHGFPPKPLPTDQLPAALSHGPSPIISHAQPASPFGSVASQDAVTPSAPTPMHDIVEVQQRLLHDVERQKQRKLKEREEEIRKEAERKERLRKKLEALAPPEETKPKPKEESPARRAQKSPQTDKVVPAATHSPPKPPVPTSEGEVAQYGMMKVHQPHPVKKPSPAQITTPKLAASKPSPSPVKAQPEPQPRSQPQTQSSSSPAPPSTGTTRDNVGTMPQPQQPQPLAQQSIASDAEATKPGQPPQAPWSTSLPHRGQGWTSNVWGPPQAMNRALGNGTFAQQVAPQAKTSPVPAPIGSSPAVKPSSSQPQAPPNQAFTQNAMYPQTGVVSAQVAAAPKPGPIAPPADKGWGNFHANIRRDDRENLVKAQETFERMGGASFRPEIRETYVDAQGKTHTTVHGPVGGIEATAPQHIAAPDSKPKDDSVKSAHEAPSPPQAINQGAQLQPSTHGARSSRFFPRAPEAAAQASSTSSKDESPPPPETETHPAFSGDTSHPIVKIPRPPPRVRLPPTAVDAAASAEAPVSMPPRTRFGIGARPLALNPEWQARFNSLLEKPTAPGVPHASVSRPHPPTQAGAHAKTGALAIAASSKAPLEVRPNITPATVSLPAFATRKPFANDGSRDVTTRVGAEFLLEDREFGSLPTVRLSQVPHLAASEPPAAFPPTPRQNSRYRQPAMEVQSIDAYEVRVPKQSEKDVDTFAIPIRLGNMSSTVTKSLSKKRSHGKGPGQAKSKRNFNNGANDSPANGQNQRPRKPSNYQGQGSNSNGSPRPSPGNAWSNSRSTPQNHPWSRRPASAAPVH